MLAVRLFLVPRGYTIHLLLPCAAVLFAHLVAAAADPAHAATRADLERRLTALLAAHGLTAATDTMPLDEGIKNTLPDQTVR